jgi:hypothetical protein
MGSFPAAQTGSDSWQDTEEDELFVLEKRLNRARKKSFLKKTGLSPLT